MSLQTVQGWCLPLELPYDVDNPYNTDLLIDAAAEKGAWVFACPKAGEIVKIGFRIAAMTVNANSKIRVGIQTVSTSTGAPSGTYWDGGIAYADVLGSTLSANAWNTVEIPSTTISSSDVGINKMAVVIEYGTTSTPNDGFTAGDTIQVSAMAIGGRLLPIGQQYLTGWAAKILLPFCGLEYDDGSYPYIPGVMPFNATPAALTYKSDSTPDEVGIRIYSPFAFSVNGFWMTSNAAPAADLQVVLYTGDTEIEAFTADKDILRGSIGPYYSHFNASHTLAANTVHRLTIKPTSTTTGNCKPYEVTVANAALMYALPGGIAGTSVYKTERTDGGVWTDTNTKRVLMGLILDGIDIPTLPAAADVIEGAAGDVTGTYHEAAVAEVQSGVMFGAGSALEGTYAGGSGGGSGIIRSNLNRAGVIQ